MSDKCPVCDKPFKTVSGNWHCGSCGIGDKALRVIAGLTAERDDLRDAVGEARTIIDTMVNTSVWLDFAHEDNRALGAAWLAKWGVDGAGEVDAQTNP